jgi:hypothetical protein
MQISEETASNLHTSALSISLRPEHLRSRSSSASGLRFPLSCSSSTPSARLSNDGEFRFKLQQLSHGLAEHVMAVGYQDTDANGPPAR